ncbi:MAG: hypothetical protein KF802_13985 [Bdellovibrionaceae bacterium]|nr:hypothetical protein [Pseudobdellovibrionaceae bacterium]MBX3033138.1 hypothetical protein [Pseudobdellovibrionaceae bacterium]
MKLMIAALVSVSAVAFANPPAKTTKQETVTTTTKTEKIDCKDVKNKDHADCKKPHATH